MDKHLPGTPAAQSIALFTHDVYRLPEELRDPASHRGRRKVKAITPGVETVVVSHSLGTVVAYNLIRREGGRKGVGWCPS